MKNLSNPLFQTLIDHLVEPVFIKDDEHRVIKANQAFFDIFQMEASEVIGQTMLEKVPKHEADVFLSADKGVFETGKQDFREEELTVGGKTHTIMTCKRRYTGDDGKYYLICSIQDITTLKATEASLLEEKAKLETALKEISSLKDIIPVCSYCRKIRDDAGAWQQLEEYVAKHTNSKVSHGICPSCSKEHFPNYDI